ncbi:MAG: hypothetical protein DMD90_17590 [Candidatus Rokuibacteriota bacterium]|nr:MAG: hypothetical protein DMD90_17590 [Candidatus Rokubacteria bacterium]
MAKIPITPGARGRSLSPGTDQSVLEQIRAVTNSRATYGYRRVWAMVNRTFRTGYNRNAFDA